MQLCQTICQQEGRLRGIASHLEAEFDSRVGDIGKIHESGDIL